MLENCDLQSQNAGRLSRSNGHHVAHTRYLTVESALTFFLSLRFNVSFLSLYVYVNTIFLMSEDSLYDPVLSFYHVCPKDQTMSISLGCKQFYLVNHATISTEP